MLSIAYASVKYRIHLMAWHLIKHRIHFIAWYLVKYRGNFTFTLDILCLKKRFCCEV